MAVIEDPVESAVAVQPVAVPARGAFHLRTFAGDASLVIGSAILANAFNYLYHFVLSRRLGPDAYGTLATLLAIAAIVGVVGTSISTVALQETARMWAARADDCIAPFVRRVGPAALAVAAATAVLVFAASVPLWQYLHIVQPLLWLTFAGYLLAGLSSAFVRGAAQGAHRFGFFSGSLVAEAVAKLVCGVALVTIGWRVAGAVGALLAGALVGLVIVAVPVSMGGRRDAAPPRGHLELGGEALRVLYVTAAMTALLFIDMIFAKHHLSGDAAGFYGAAGTLARTIPYGIGLIGLVLMPKAAAAHHLSRHSLSRLLCLAFSLALFGIALGLFVTQLFAGPLLAVSYGPKFAAAEPLLRLYGINGALLGVGIVCVAYLMAIRDYAIGIYLIGAVAIEAVIMAVLGTTAVKLLLIAIAVNATLAPLFVAHVLRSLRTAPQANALSSGNHSP